MGLRVPVPDPKRCVPVVPVHTLWNPIGAPAPVADPTRVPPMPGPDGLCEFDEMNILEVMALFEALFSGSY